LGHGFGRAAFVARFMDLANRVEQMNTPSLWLLVLSGSLLAGHAVWAQPVSPTTPPFRSQAATFEIDAGDTVADHLCPTGYLVSVSAHNGNANIPVVFVDRRHNGAAAGKWLQNAAGFRLQTASFGAVSVQMVCSAP
jgi:hypothetical protein